MVSVSDIVHLCGQFFDEGVGVCSKLFSTAFWFDLLVTYKYWIVVLGALIEGELILMIAAATAYHGHISIYLVISFAIMGAILHDHVLYWVGYRLQATLKKEKYARKAEKINKLVNRYGIYFVATFRFLYGIRTITPIILGATHKFSLKIYSICVILSSIVWAVIISYLGYSFALVFEWFSEEFKRVKSIVFYSVIGCIVLFFSVYILKKLLRGTRG